MTWDRFWNHLQTGGTTPDGLRYAVINNEKLHIISPSSKNKNFYITKETVKKYFTKLYEEEIDPKEFKYFHSYWFYQVYKHILGIQINKISDKKPLKK